jgi:small subunit ribosomal protein S20
MASAKPKKKNPRLASGRKRVRQDTKLNAANTSRSRLKRQPPDTSQASPDRNSPVRRLIGVRCSKV